MKLNVKNDFSTNIDISSFANDELGLHEVMKNARNIEEVEIPKNLDSETIHPSEFKIGDLMFAEYGYVGEIVKINKTECEYGSDGLRYTFSLSYVAGDLQKYKYFIGRICNGCVTGNLSLETGNDRCRWDRAYYVDQDDLEGCIEEVVEIFEEEELLAFPNADAFWDALDTINTYESEWHVSKDQNKKAYFLAYRTARKLAAIKKFGS